MGDGIVHLVGAGPGDPQLITLRGRTLLEQADVVVYDYLANPKLLDYCPQAELIYVGKKAAQHTFTQEQINQLLAEKARQGKRVVRLKGGDPFVFGRGGEECQALHEAGVRFEVVPGVTAAIGSATYAGIPVTHRDFNSSFTLVTGHEKGDDDRADDGCPTMSQDGASDIDWAALARMPCLAFYMGVRSLPKICQRLINHGMDAQTPAATIQWGTTPRQRTIVATLADLPVRAAEAGISSPAITIVGKVVELRAAMNWFESRPLFGQTIVVTRTRQQAGELALPLEELGANVIEAPTIELSAPEDWSEVDDALRRSGQYDWIIFSSVNGVAFVRQRLRELNLDARVFGRSRIVAIGQSTAAAVQEQLCLRVDLCPKRFISDALADELAQANLITGRRFLLLRPDIASPTLRERLKQSGAAEVRDVAIYRTRPVKSLPSALIEALVAGDVNWVTFTSSSTARNFIALLGSDYLKLLANVKLASIGPVTTQTLDELGLKATVQAETYDISGLVQAMVGR